MQEQKNTHITCRNSSNLKKKIQYKKNTEMIVQWLDEERLVDYSECSAPALSHVWRFHWSHRLKTNPSLRSLESRWKISSLFTWRNSESGWKCTLALQADGVFFHTSDTRGLWRIQNSMRSCQTTCWVFFFKVIFEELSVRVCDWNEIINAKVCKKTPNHRHGRKINELMLEHNILCNIQYIDGVSIK